MEASIIVKAARSRPDEGDGGRDGIVIGGVLDEDNWFNRRDELGIDIRILPHY